MFQTLTLKKTVLKKAKLNYNDLKNYRPVSYLSSLSQKYLNVLSGSPVVGQAEANDLLEPF